MLYGIPVNGIDTDDDLLLINAPDAESAAREWHKRVTQTAALRSVNAEIAQIHVQPMKPVDMAEWFADVVLTKLESIDEDGEAGCDAGWIRDYDEMFYDADHPDVADFKTDLRALYAKHAHLFQHAAIADDAPVLIETAGWAAMNKEAQDG